MLFSALVDLDYCRNVVREPSLYAGQLRPCHLHEPANAEDARCGRSQGGDSSFAVSARLSWEPPCFPADLMPGPRSEEENVEVLEHAVLTISRLVFLVVILHDGLDAFPLQELAISLGVV